MHEKKNEEIKSALKEAGLKQWELAEKLGVAETTLCRWLRTELPAEKKQKMLQVIEDYDAEKEC